MNDAVSRVLAQEMSEKEIEKNFQILMPLFPKAFQL